MDILTSWKLPEKSTLPLNLLNLGYYIRLDIIYKVFTSHSNIRVYFIQTEDFQELEFTREHPLDFKIIVPWLLHWVGYLFTKFLLSRMIFLFCQSGHFHELEFTREIPPDH